MKILGLHGYKNSSLIFTIQTKHLRRLSNNLEWNIPNAPNISSENIPMEVKKYFKPPYYYWYDINNSNYGLDKTLYYLYNYSKKYGPFDGIIGFSQGASMAYLLSTLIEINFVINICGVNYPNMCNDSKKINIPSLNIIGKNDPYKERSLMLANYYYNPEIYYCNSEHVFPSDYKSYQTILNFINQH